MPKIEQKLIINEVAYHRNGVSGVPFHVIKFWDKTEGEPERFMLGILFDHEGYEEVKKKDGWANPYCAVFDLDLLSAGNITFGENSFRGDHYADALCDAIAKYNRKERRKLNKWINEQSAAKETGGSNG